MVASRSRVMGAYYPARFWLSACCAALMPTSIGYQDLAALLAHQHGAPSSWHMIASPFGTVEAATFRYTRPTGTEMPDPLGFFQPVNFDPRSLDAYAWKIDEPLTTQGTRQIEYPSVNRAHKGDRLPASNTAPATADPASLPQLQPISAPGSAPSTAPSSLPGAQPVQPGAPAVTPPLDKAQQHADDSTTAPMNAHDESAPPSAPDATVARAGATDDDDTIADKPPELPAPGETNEASSSIDELSFLDDDAADRSGQVYFGSDVMGSPAGLERWAPGAEPILVPPAGSDLKLSALEDTDTGAGETIAGKDNSRLLSPAQQLGLEGKTRAHAEKCLADAVYFEARGEVMKGQEAVAQVVMNRVFSGYYPHDVCGVVYQNANRHLACQFTFACEGKDLSKIDEPDMWEQAKRIAKDTLDGKIWLAEVGHATHYHAYWVHPSWVHEMARLYHLGVHTFYRPLNWGNGDDEPVWGKGPAAIAVRLDPEALNEDPEPAPKNPGEIKGPQAAVTPAADSNAPTAKL